MTMPAPLRVRFCAGAIGPWRIDRAKAIIGEGLARADRLAIEVGPDPSAAGALWSLLGVVSHKRYTTAAEAAAMEARASGLDRPEARCAALIPIRKSPAWWALAQDERRAIYEERSRHTTIGMAYMPRIARRLHHSRDLGEPFDFLTWFEFAPEHADAFDELLDRLRASEEWDYVDREVDIRLTREA